LPRKTFFLRSISFSNHDTELFHIINPKLGSAFQLYSLNFFRYLTEMAVTRHATGNSKPRAFTTVSTEPATKKRAAGTKKKAASNKTATGRVTKKEPATHHKRKPTLGDKVKGAAKKLEGTIERKPGKKGVYFSLNFPLHCTTCSSKICHHS
jgi:hypothetical protein